MGKSGKRDLLMPAPLHPIRRDRFPLAMVGVDVDVHMFTTPVLGAPAMSYIDAGHVADSYSDNKSTHSQPGEERSADGAHDATRLRGRVSSDFRRKT